MGFSLVREVFSGDIANSWNNNHECSLVPRRKKEKVRKHRANTQLYELIKAENNLGVSEVENLFLITDRAYEMTFILILLNSQSKENLFGLTRCKK